MTTILLIAFAPLLSVEATACKIQIMHDFCSSGLVQTDFSKADLTYKFHQGDAHCWGGDFDVTGQLNHLGASYPYYADATYELLDNDKNFSEAGHFGKISYDPKVKMATVEILTDGVQTKKFIT